MVFFSALFNSHRNKLQINVLEDNRDMIYKMRNIIAGFLYTSASPDMHIQEKESKNEREKEA